MPTGFLDGRLRLKLRVGKTADAVLRFRFSDPVDFEQIVVSTVVKTLAADKVNPGYALPSIQPNAAFITVEGQPIRYRVDSGEGDPTAASGHLASAGDWIYLSAELLATFRCIRQAGSDATLHVTYLRD